MLEKIFLWLGGEAALSKKLGSLFRHLLPPIVAYLSGLNLDAGLLDMFSKNGEAFVTTLAAVIIAVLLSLREKAGK